MELPRRRFLKLAAATAAAGGLRAQSLQPETPALLTVPRYDQVAITGGIAQQQQQTAQAVLASFDDDALLKPFRLMTGQPAPGRNIGGWYEYLPDYNWHTGDAGLAPGHCFGQWTSAMARFAAAQGDSTGRQRVFRLHRLLAQTIGPGFFDKTRYPAYTLDKFNIGLLDAHRLLGSPEALAIANKVRLSALQDLPGSAYERDRVWRKGRDFSFTWDESYTLPENLYLLWEAGAGSVYREMAQAYLMDNFFGPLAHDKNILGKLHGYSHVNALGSAMQAWRIDGSQMHLQAALNGYRMIGEQTYASGGWAPDELFVAPGSGTLLTSLTASHNNFETPCGTYAQLKLSRYLLQLTRDGRYGDAMERVIYNSMFGALPLQPDGHTFYYSDLNLSAKRVYSTHRFPCCGGTYTQVAADYGINNYLLDPEPGAGVWVNLYLPSTVQWTAGNTRCELEQSGSYPLEDEVRFKLRTERPVRFPLHLRIPAWCEDATLQINSKTMALHPVRGFASVERLWRDGDQLRLQLPARVRLEPFPANGGPQPAFAALCRGALVLLPEQASTIAHDAPPTLQRATDTDWHGQAADGTPLHLRPYFAVGNGEYSTYLRLV